MGVFVLCSMMIGKSIKDNAWILLASDLIFCWLFWMFLGLSKYVSYGSSLSRKYLPRAIILGISMIIMFILIAMATLGVSISNSMVLFNIWVFPIMVFITLGLSLNYRSKRFA
ncbi:MAG: hypothetical protein WCG25_07900 [bacterium]